MMLKLASLGMPTEMDLAKVIVALLCPAVATVAAQRQAFAQDQPSQSTSAYLPKIGDFMGQTQLRHFKLWFAGSVGNWALANYELGQIRDGFDTAAKLYPTLGSAPFAQLLKDGSGPPLADIGKAIEARSNEDFVKAFERLTSDCNACHKVAHVGFIRIRVPTSSPFTDQSFPPE
jgi:hypothetical protein